MRQPTLQEFGPADGEGQGASGSGAGDLDGLTHSDLHYTGRRHLKLTGGWGHHPRDKHNNRVQGMNRG